MLWTKRVSVGFVLAGAFVILSGCGDDGEAVAPPTITTHPSDQTVAEGQTATFSVVASGSGSVSYQWLKDTVAIPGAISSSHTTPATTASRVGSRRPRTPTGSIRRLRRTQWRDNRSEGRACPSARAASPGARAQLAAPQTHRPRRPPRGAAWRRPRPEARSLEKPANRFRSPRRRIRLRGREIASHRRRTRLWPSSLFLQERRDEPPFLERPGAAEPDIGFIERRRLRETVGASERLRVARDLSAAEHALGAAIGPSGIRRA